MYIYIYIHVHIHKLGIHIHMYSLYVIRLCPLCLFSCSGLKGPPEYCQDGTVTLLNYNKAIIEYNRL